MDLSSLFGGGYSEPDIPQATSMPTRDEVEDETSRDAERKKLRARQGGVRSTLLSNNSQNNISNLLGINTQGNV